MLSDTVSRPWKNKLVSGDSALILLCILLSFNSFLVLLNARINPDEIEHVHSAWYMANGYTPYRDFFQHHSPYFWYLLTPFNGLQNENPYVIIHIRALMFVFYIATAFIAALCATKLGGHRRYGYLTFLIILTVSFHAQRSIHIRPDGLCVLLSIISFYFFLETLNGSQKAILFTAIFISLAFLTIQKAVFFSVFYTIFYAIQLLRRKINPNLFLAFILILGSPIIISIIYGLSIGELSEYIFNNYLLNILKRGVSGNLVDLSPVFLDNWFFWMVSLIGVVYALRKRTAHPRLFFTSLLGVTILVAALSSSFHPQYFLPAVPLLSISSSLFLLQTVNGKGKLGSFTLVVVVLAYLYVPVTEFKHVRHDENDEQLTMIGYLTESTARDACVYDEGRLFNLFRKDAHYLWYHPGLRRQYIQATGRFRSFNRCDVIRDNTPAVVNARTFRFSTCSASDRYRESQYQDIYLLEAHSPFP